METVGPRYWYVIDGDEFNVFSVYKHYLTNFQSIFRYVIELLFIEFVRQE